MVVFVTQVRVWKLGNYIEKTIVILLFYSNQDSLLTIQKQHSPNKSSLNEMLSTISCFMTFAFETYSFGYRFFAMAGKN